MKTDVSVEMVTPTMAKNWLANRYDGQRNIRPTHVVKLATSILEGHWKTTSDAITLIKGRLANGQHRCLAIEKANKACMCLVLRTNDDGLFDVIDSGVSRTIADVLTQENTQYSALMASVGVIVCKYNKRIITKFSWSSGIKMNDKNTNVITRSEVLEYCRTHKDELIDNIKFINPLYSQGLHVLQKSYACALLQLVPKKDLDKAKEFIADIYKGDTQNMARDLHDRLIKNKLAFQKFPTAYLFAMLIKTYKMYLNNPNIRTKHIKFGEKEEFPYTL
jgi:hypothetical protein